MYNKYENIGGLEKIAKYAFAKAAASLSIFMQKEVEISVPEARTALFNEVFNFVEPVDSVNAVVYLHVEGETPGKMALFFPMSSADYIIKTLLGTETKTELFSDLMAQSALKEIGNIMVSSFVTTITDYTYLSLQPSPPVMAIDMAGAIIGAILTEDGMMDDEVLLISTVFKGDKSLRGQLVFFPNSGSLEKLLGAIKNVSDS